MKTSPKNINIRVIRLSLAMISMKTQTRGKNANKDLRLSEIMGLIDREEMREYNITEYVSIDEHHKYKRAIEDALAYVYSRKAKEVNRHMDVMYISGPAGSGKTTFAKWYCEQQKMSYTVSSSSNDPMQDYKGQDVLILDDFRPSEWKMTDFLKLLDNHTTSSVRSRYQNKYMCYCKCIIITSVIPLSKVWDFLQDKDDKEPLNSYIGVLLWTVKCLQKRLQCVSAIMS